jgi:flagellin
MSLSVLTNISALEAGSSLALTQARLQGTLLQLSSGSRINSGADDAAGLAIVAGLGANRAALTQSSDNAETGIGLLRVADGALSQVTTLLDRAVTLATEAENGTLNSAQVSSADAEYQAILREIHAVGATTTANGQAVFTDTPTSIYVGDGSSSGSAGEVFEVGALSLTSIGQNPQTHVVSGPVVPVVGAPAAAIDTAAGVYTLATAAPGDTLSGTLAVQVGGSGPVTQLTVTAGTTQAQMAALVNGNGTLAAEGVTATLDGSGNLQIRGPASGSTLSFAGTSLVDAETSTPFVPTATPATPATQAVSFLYEDNALGGNDPITAGGTLTATFNGSTYQYTAPPGTVLNDIYRRCRPCSRAPASRSPSPRLPLASREGTISFSFSLGHLEWRDRLLLPALWSTWTTEGRLRR